MCLFLKSVILIYFKLFKKCGLKNRKEKSARDGNRKEKSARTVTGNYIQANWAWGTPNSIGTTGPELEFCRCIKKLSICEAKQLTKPVQKIDLDKTLFLIRITKIFLSIIIGIILTFNKVTILFSIF